jgi:hypothetical protein
MRLTDFTARLFPENPARAGQGRAGILAGWARCAGAGLAAAVPFTTPSKGFMQWLDEEVIKRVQITGSRTIGYHQHDVEGDREAFETLNYYGFGGKRFTDVGAINVSGRNVAGLFNFQSTVVNNRFVDPQSEKSSIDYNRRPFTVNVGDIHGSLLNSNRFASFNKLLQGAQAKYQHGRLAVKGVVSESRGSAKTVSLQGNNSSGPYYLQSSQIVRGSEAVEVDGQRMQLGQDYVISYEAGTITFVGRVIAPTSTIVVSFESLGFNTGFGTVTGVGATYDMGRWGRIGLTRMSQDTGSGDALSSRVELFQGSGAPSTPYFLQFEPLLSRPITVKLDGIPQTQGVDYRFDSVNPSIFYFLRFVPFTSTIEVVYTPKPTSTVSGDREVMGFDYRLPLGPNGQRGHIAYYQATGKQKSETSPLKGTARGMDASYRFGPWELRGAVRSVPTGYVSVETRGFNRNEDAVDFGAKYKAKKLEVDLSGNNSRVALRQVTSGGDIIFRRADTDSFRALARYRPQIGTTWDLEHSRSANRSLGNRTTLQRTSLMTGQSFGRLLVRGGVEQQNGRGPISDSQGNSLGVQNVDLRSYLIEASYTAGDAWAFRGRTSLSDVKTSSKSGKGQDHFLGVSYTPSSRFSLNGSYTKSDSGAVATLGGFDTGFGLGYGGNGFSGGATGPGFFSGGTDVELIQLNGSYAINDRSSIVASFVDSRASGNISSNSRSRAYSLGLDWDFGRGHALALSLAQSTTRFLGTQTDIDSTTLNLDFAGSPSGRFSYRLGASLFLTGGGSQFGQDSLYLDASLTYRLAPRQTLSLYGTSGYTSGYLPQAEDSVGISYAYQIFRNIALVGSYRIRDVRNRNTTNPLGAYKSRGFDIELTFQFVP